MSEFPCWSSSGRLNNYIYAKKRKKKKKKKKTDEDIITPISGCQATESEAACCLGLIPFIELFILWLLGPSTSAMAEARCVACYLFICFTDLPSHSPDWVRLRAFGANDCPFNRGRTPCRIQFHTDRWWPFLFMPHFCLFLLSSAQLVPLSTYQRHTASKPVLLTIYTTPLKWYSFQRLYREWLL